ncbi:hypothetical protein BB558_002609 [Smittium angustum]|uniref:CAP-Gly domain-containing protein n=1 Tax=Smittium angustum TaxID=133377 RepID=A0A2U1J8L0_SMIAN|nr:hypothetical protein BB558_002609 [Smittium angustum]
MLPTNNRSSLKKKDPRSLLQSSDRRLTTGSLTRTNLQPIHSTSSLSSNPEADNISEKNLVDPDGTGSKFHVGKVVIAQEKRGTIRFLGETSFSAGIWAGIELDEPLGKNDGTVQGVRYFQAKPNHGLFVRPSQIKQFNPELPPPIEIKTENRRQSTRIPSIGSKTPLKTISGISENRRQTLNISRSSSMNSKSPTPPLSGRNSRSGSSRGNIPSSLSSQHIDKKGAELSSSASFTSIPEASNLQDTIPTVIISERRERIDDDTSQSNKHVKLTDGLITESDQELESPSNLDTNNSNKDIDSNMNQDNMDAKQTWRPALSMSESIMYENSSKPLKQNQMIPLVQFEEVKAKLKFLEQKRSEERTLVLEAEELKSIHGQTMRTQERLVSKIKELSSELQQMKTDLKKTQEQVQILEITLDEERGTLELVTVEKEMAEEQSEGHKQDSLILKEQLEELQDKIKLYEGTEAVGSSENSSLEFAQIRAKNVRLAEALRMLRDEKESEVDELKKQLRDFEKESIAGKQISVIMENQKSQIEQQNQVIEDLKQRLEDVEDSEELISELSYRNLKLNERVGDLESQVEHWQSMHEVSEEMYEGHVDEVKQLNSEIDRLEWQIRERDLALKNTKETLDENVAMLARFRDAVAQLQDEQKKALEREHEMQLQVQSTGEATKNLENLAFSAGRAMQTVTSRGIELELQKLEARQARTQIKLFSMYLPNDIDKNDLDSITGLLMLQKVSFKADLICKQLEQRSEGNENVNREFLNTAVTRRQLILCAREAEVIAAAINTASEDELSKLAVLLSEATAADRHLNELLEYVMKGEITIQFTAKQAESVLSILDRMNAKTMHLSNSYVDQCKIRLYVYNFGYYVDEIQCNLLLIVQKLPFASEAIESLLKTLKAIKVILIKSQIKLQELKQGNLEIDLDSASVFSGILGHMERVKKFFVYLQNLEPWLFEDSSEASNLVEIDENKFIKIFNDATQSVYEKADNYLLENLGADLEISKNNSQDIYDHFCDKSIVHAKEAPISPWEARAKRISSGIKEREDSEKQIVVMKKELMTLAKSVKQRELQIEEMRAQTQVLERRCTQLKDYEGLFKSNSTELEKAQAIKNELEKLVESLHSEIDNLKTESRKMSSKVTSQNIETNLPLDSNTYRNVDGAVITESEGFGNLNDNNRIIDQLGQSGISISKPISDQVLLRQLHACRLNLKFAKTEESRLKSIISEAGSRLSTNRDMIRSSILANSSTNTKKNFAIPNGLVEAKTLVKDAMLLAASARMVKLGPVENSDEKTEKKTILYNAYWQLMGAEKALAKKALDLSSKMI